MSVKRIDDEWEAVCDHGPEEWAVRRSAEHIALRSLKAHQKGCLIHALRTELPDEDEFHPLSVLGVWALMLAEDYGLEVPDPLTITSAAAFLDGIVGKVAQDENQDFPLLRRELNTCWNRVEMALAIKRSPQKGAPCPECVATGKVDPGHVRLSREFPHWCDDPDCEKFHYDTDEADVWRCPRNRDHWWTAEGYVNLMEERKVGA